MAMTRGLFGMPLVIKELKEHNFIMSQNVPNYTSIENSLHMPWHVPIKYARKLALVGILKVLEAVR